MLKKLDRYTLASKFLMNWGLIGALITWSGFPISASRMTVVLVLTAIICEIYIAFRQRLKYVVLLLAVICIIGVMDYLPMAWKFNLFMMDTKFVLAPSFVNEYVVGLKDVWSYFGTIYNYLTNAAVVREVRYFLSFSVVLSILSYGSIHYLLYKRRSVMLFIGPVAVFLSMWFGYMDDIAWSFSLFFLGYLIYFGLLKYNAASMAIDEDEVGGKYYKYKDVGKYLVLLSILVVILSNLVMSAFPLDRLNEAISSKLPGNLGYRSGYTQKSSELFYFSDTVYQSGSNYLGGPVELSDALVFRVKSSKSDVYLRGRVSTDYDGSRWYSRNTVYTGNSNLMDHYVTTKSYELIRMEIYPDNLITATLFAPLGTYNFELENANIYRNVDGVFYYKYDPFERVLESYELIGTGKDITIENQEDYLVLPEAFPQSVRTLSYEITEGYESNLEKATAIQNYLREHYTYNLNVPKPERNRDFVEQFLFETKEGYCTYFATSLATMCRAVGIPSRYVEGFVLPQEKDEEGVYHVTADLAHSWVEIYVDELGWIALEATPIYEGVDVQPPSDSKDETLPAINDFTHERDLSEDEMDFQYIPDDEEVEKGRVVPTGVIVAGLMMLVGGGAFMAIRFIKKNGDDRTVALKAIYKIEKKLLNRFYLERAHLSTGEIIDLYLNENDLEEFYNIKEIVDKILYSDRCVTINEYDSIEAFRKYVFKNVK